MNKNEMLFEKFFYIIEETAVYMNLSTDGLLDTSDLIAIGVLAFEKIQKIKYVDEEHFSLLLRKRIKWDHAELFRTTCRHLRIIDDRQEDVIAIIDTRSNDRMKEAISSLSEDAQTLAHLIVNKGVELFGFDGTDTKRTLRKKVRQYTQKIHGRDRTRVILSELQFVFQ